MSFDLSFISTLIKNIVEDEGAIFNVGSISWISINGGSYQENRVHVVDIYFHPCVGVLLGAAYHQGQHFKRRVDFSSLLSLFL